MTMIAREQIAGSETLDHLGLVAATIDKLGLVPMIDELLPVSKEKGAKTTMGQRVSAMIMNGLGFIDDRLYMFPKFLSNKPVEKLIGEGVSSDDFNDDALGRCLDSIYAYGTTKMFSELALPIGLRHNVISRKSHVDTTTLTVYGDYDEEDDEIDNNAAPLLAGLQPNLDTVLSQYVDLAVPKHGHAKNHRHDLKQMTLLLATSGAAGFPIWMEAHSGNASDKKTLELAAERMQRFCNALALAPSFLHVGDSAMYLSCIERGDDILWLSRVPEAIKIAKALITRTDIVWQSIANGYQIYELPQTYKNVEQRWLLVFSEHAYKNEVETLGKNITKEQESLTNAVWHLSNQPFGCEKDALKAVTKLQKGIKYHTLSATIRSSKKYAGRGKPKKDAPYELEYYVSATVITDEAAIAQAKLTKGRFILATNQLDTHELPTEAILATYKEQSATESGFKFIKDDAFELDSVFLKKPERINALMMVMTLCLMVYSFAEHFLRQALESKDETLPLQTGRLSKKPSMKWIYRMFQGVHVLKLRLGNSIDRIVLNLDDTLRRIICYFGDVACKIYDLQPEMLSTS